ncbi:MAG TPA: hypothetical protein VL172_17920 [Kofleriaceae bacterium]|nr:hypothetical protein [Kofleriaceae bacterium]
MSWVERFLERVHGGGGSAAGAGDDTELGTALAGLPEAFDRDPALVDDFAEELAPVAERLGGAARLGWQIASLRARIEAAADDDVREHYSELLDEYRADPGAVARIRLLGRRIDELTREGKLPRALVLRGSWRRDER